MSQSKTTTGSPKSPMSPDGSPKSDSAPSSPSKSGHSPSTKSSPGNGKTLSLSDRLLQSKTANKISPKLKSPGSKSPPSTPSTTTKTDVFKGSTDQILKSVEAEKNQVSNSSFEVKVENNQLSSEQHSVIVESKPSVLVNDIKQDVSIESDQTEVKENEMIKSDSNNVIVVEDPENSIKPLRIEDNVILEQMSKKDIRQKVWEFMEENSLVVFPKPCFNRIPNFRGCNNASQMLEKLEEFQKAKTVQVTPDKAQEIARFITLSWGKRLLVPLLRLKDGLLQIVSLPFAEPSTKVLKSASTQKGLRKWGNKLITLDHNSDGYHIDMIILGSVAIDRKGHRIGIGNGLCDLEFAILSYMNMVTDKTIVVTIVHDAQVFENLSTNLFKPYDVPVDIIITQTEIIRVEKRLDRPKDVFWNYISKRRLLEMPPLQLLRTKQENMGDIDCTLKDVDSEPEEIPSTPKVFKKFKGYRRRRLYSTRSETNDSVFKDTEVSKLCSNSKPSAAVTKNSESKAKRKRAKSTSSQQHRSNSASRGNNQNEPKDSRSSKKPNKRRTKSESAKTVVSPPTVSDSKQSNGIQTTSPSNDSPKNKRRSRQKPRQQVNSDDVDKQSVPQSNTKPNGNNKRSSRSNSRVTRRDYIDHQGVGRELSMGRKTHREYIQSPRKYYSQSRRSSYSQDRLSNNNFRSDSRIRYEINRSTGIQQNRYSNSAIGRPSRYFNNQMVRHNDFNGPIPRQNVMNNHVIRQNSYTNDPLPRQNNYYDGYINRNNYSKGSAIRHDGYTNSRVFRPPVYRNGMVSQTDERDYVRELRPRYNNNNRSGYFNSNEKPNYSRSNSGDEFVLKVGNIANNVRVRDLKAALMDRGVKPLHITWRGPRGFAYLRYNNSSDMNKDNIMGSLQNVRIMPNGVETAQTQTLIVTECQFS